ncbi:MAG: flagellar filament capping protein FliD, partial [Synergistaceae bacterium]|nr:flagellar filament capping protein FliD [Synergistaceae bacterium]
DLNANLTWNAPTKTAHDNLPSSDDELSFTYRYSSNTFQIDDGGSGLLSALGLDLTDEEHMTEAQDAIVAFDGEEWNLVSNELDYENDILNGVKMEFKGVGEVSVEVTHDTEKAVEAVQTYVDAYNALMDWINTRSSEKQVNTDYSEDNTNVLSTNSDDFHTSWGLLYGNSYLRSTKTTLRTLMGQNFSYTFKERTSSEAVYGTMEFNGLKQDTTTTLRIAVGTRWANITITPEDTLDTIAAKINDTTNNEIGNEAWQLHYVDSGSLQNYVKAEVVNDKLVIRQGTTATDEVSLSGTTAMNLLHMNYQYKGLYQIGIETTSDNYGISGELEFDSVAFTDALEENPEETEQLMMAFAKQMDAQMKKMLQSSGGYSGTLTQEIQNIESQITTIDEYLKKFQDRLDRQEESLRSQYAAAEERISKLSQQASSIAGIMSQLGSGGGSGSSGSGS